MALLQIGRKFPIEFAKMQNPKFGLIIGMICCIMIQAALMDMLQKIKVSIQTQTPTTELVTKQITQAMMESMMKDGSEQPLMPQITPEQLAGVYSTFPGATPEHSVRFPIGGLQMFGIKMFVTPCRKAGRYFMWEVFLCYRHSYIFFQINITLIFLITS